MASTSRGIPLLDGTEPVAPLQGYYNNIANALNTALDDLDSELGPGAHFYSGTGTQRAAFLSAAAEGDAWQDTDGAKLMFVKKAGAWVAVVQTGTFSPGSGMTIVAASTLFKDVAGNVTGLLRTTGTITNAKTIATLPVGFRPAATFPIGGVSSGSGTAWSPFDIFANGEVKIYSPFATSPTGATLSFSFKAA